MSDEKSKRMKVCTDDRMCFYVDAETLEPMTVSTFDAWCFSDPDAPVMSHAEWVRLKPIAIASTPNIN